MYACVLVYVCVYGGRGGEKVSSRVGVCKWPSCLVSRRSRSREQGKMKSEAQAGEALQYAMCVKMESKGKKAKENTTMDEKQSPGRTGVGEKWERLVGRGIQYCARMPPLRLSARQHAAGTSSNAKRTARAWTAPKCLQSGLSVVDI